MKLVRLEALKRVVECVTTFQSPVDQMVDGNELAAQRAAQGIARTLLNPATGEESALTWKGQAALSDLIEEIRANSPELMWGTDYKSLDSVTGNFILNDLRGRDAASINADDAKAFTRAIEGWFNESAVPRKHFIPCAILPDQAPAFDVGPVRFAPLQELMQERAHEGQLSLLAFRKLSEMAAERHATWVAIVTVNGCVGSRSAFVADVAVDLALGYLQLGTSLDYARNMARVTARAVPAWKGTVSEAGGRRSSGVENLMPGLGLSGSAFALGVQKSQRLRDSVGRRILAFLSQSSQYPNLEQGWCDSIYWYRESLAESIDSIAVAKYETTIEVLLRAESNKKSSPKMRQAFKAYLNKVGTDTVFDRLPMTVDQFTEHVVTVRSRVLHGTFSTLLLDSRVSRGQVHELARVLLMLSTVQLDRYLAVPGRKDDVDAFLGWVEANRTTADAAQMHADKKS